MIDRNEDGSPCYETFEAPDNPELDYETVELTPAMLAAMAQEEAEWYERESARCPERLAIYLNASGTIGEMCDQIKVHEKNCSRCGEKQALPQPKGAASEQAAKAAGKQAAA